LRENTFSGLEGALGAAFVIAGRYRFLHHHQATSEAKELAYV
jgi:hypothetical protein